MMPGYGWDGKDRRTYIARATQKLRTVCIRPLSHTADCEEGSSESNGLLHRE